MSKIAIIDLSFYYGDYFHPVFENVNLVLDTDWKLGLIGRNGRGKSTFLKLLMGELAPTAGNISMSVNMEYFPYEPDGKYHQTLDVVKEAVGGLTTMEARMEELAADLEAGQYEQYCQVQTEYAELGGYEMEGLILKEMALMGLPEELAYRDFAALSGGELTRMMIIALFLRPNSFVLLDEPTNHLDITGKELMAEYLRRKKGFIVVSHDRDFLDIVTDHIMSINKSNINVEKGNYSSWRENMDRVEEYEFRTRDRLEREVRELERRSKQTRGWAGEANTQKYAFKCNARTNGSQSYMRQAKRSEEQILDNLEEKKKLLLNYEVAKTLTIEQREGDSQECLLKAEKLSFAYSGGEPLFENVNFSLHAGDRAWIKGRNGAGKSTFLKILTGERKVASVIEYVPELRVAVSAQEPLWTEGLIGGKFDLPAQQKAYQRFLELCDSFDLPENFLERPLETFSSGELKKVDIARALAEEGDILFLDEPLNYMDVYFREQLEKAILESEPTMVFVEHDSRFGKNVSNKVLEL